MKRTNNLHKPGTKRVLDGHDRKQLSMPPVLLHTSWALGAGLAFGRHFTISEEKKIKKCKTIGHCPTQHLVCTLGYNGEKRQEVAKTIMTDTTVSEISMYLIRENIWIGMLSSQSKWNSLHIFRPKLYISLSFLSSTVGSLCSMSTILCAHLDLRSNR